MKNNSVRQYVVKISTIPYKQVPQMRSNLFSIYMAPFNIIGKVIVFPKQMGFSGIKITNEYVPFRIIYDPLFKIIIGVVICMEQIMFNILSNFEVMDELIVIIIFNQMRLPFFEITNTVMMSGNDTDLLLK